MNKKIVLILIAILVTFGSYGAITKITSSNDSKIINVPKKDSIENDRNSIVGSSKYMHISVDDFLNPFLDITENEYKSIFENDTFGLLKSLNEEYGVVFSLYVFYENEDGSFDLSRATDEFSSEFEDNSDWLKFGFHSLNNETNYENSDYQKAKKDYELVIKELIRITGTPESIDTVPRLHNFAGNDESINAFNNAEYGIDGVLGADDKRLSYNLNEEQNSYLYLYDYYKLDNLSYFRTDLRLENVQNVSDELKEYKTESASNDNNDMLIIFTHEFLLNEEEIKQKIMEAVVFAERNRYEFDFPSNRLKDENATQ